MIKKKIEKWDGFHQQHHYCPSATQPRKWNPEKVNVSNTPRWNSRGTSWKGSYYFYKIPLASLKVLKKTPWYGVVTQVMCILTRKYQGNLELSVVLKIY